VTPWATSTVAPPPAGAAACVPARAASWAVASARFTADALAPPSTTNPRNKAADAISPAVSTDTDAPRSGRLLNPRHRCTRTVLMLLWEVS